MSRQLELEEEKRVSVEDICKQAKLVVFCDVHEVALDNSDGDYESAYKLANKLVSENSKRVAMFSGDKIELRDSIKSFMDDTGNTCYVCDNQ
jgi:hypothetical protein